MECGQCFCTADYSTNGVMAHRASRLRISCTFTVALQGIINFISRAIKRSSSRAAPVSVPHHRVCQAFMNKRFGPVGRLFTNGSHSWQPSVYDGTLQPAAGERVAHLPLTPGGDNRGSMSINWRINLTRHGLKPLGSSLAPPFPWHICAPGTKCSGARPAPARLCILTARREQIFFQHG